MDDAFEEPNRTESIRKWRRIFGDSFAKGEVLEEKAQQDIDVLTEDGAGPDIVDKIKLFGAWLANKIPGRLPHVQERQYVPKLSVLIKAHLYDQIGGAKLKAMNSAEVLEKDKAIKFEAQQTDGLPFPRQDYAIEWRVVNTGKEARENRCLRGDFYESNKHGVRWEETLYRGAHWVEAFVILRRKNQCYGKSDRFFVIIE